MVKNSLTKLQQCLNMPTVSGNPSSSRPRDRRRQATIDDVIAAARDLVHEQGLAGLSMRDLGERVGLHASSIYQYFPSKLDIYDALFAHGHRQLHEHMAELDRTGDVEAVFRRGSAMFTEFCTADAVRYQLLFQRTIPGFVPSEESMALAWQSYQDMTGVLAMLGVDDQADVDLWTALQMGLTELQIANDPGGQRWSAQVGRSIDMFLGFVRERPPRRKK
jgi:AcrR family transcriptional regulator